MALPGFYCKNKGHIPAYVPFTNVNDGICDYELCCDGSEEWEGVGGTKCEGRCKEIGKEWRAQDEKRQKSFGAATKRRKEMVSEAAKLRKQVEDRIGTLKTEIESGEVKVADLSRQLGEVERREKGKIVKGSAEGKGQGKLGVLVGLARQRVDELRSNLVKVREERDKSRGQVELLEGILRTFKEEYNPNFNDEGVKRAVRSWEDYAATDRPAVEEAKERDLDDIIKEDKENGIVWEDYEEDESSETDVCKLRRPSEFL